MGGSYGSVQIRTDQRQRVKAIVEQITDELHIRVFVGPAYKGWIGIYPEHHGVEPAVGEKLAAGIDVPVLHLLVHDQDVFAYVFYQNGRRVDSYYSWPGYFGDANRAEEEPLTGNPEAFKTIVPDKVDRLAAILVRQPDRICYALEQLDAFSKTLGIANAITAYEYLKDGDHDGIKGWRQFEEIPADPGLQTISISGAVTNTAKRERQQLQSQGVLLATNVHKGNLVHLCPLGQGFLAAWPDVNWSFCQYDAPWKQPVTVALPTLPQTSGIATDASGKRIALSAHQHMQVWDLVDGQWQCTFDVAEPDYVAAVALSPDGNLVCHITHHQLFVTRIDTGQRLVAVPAFGARRVAFHPSGQWLAVARNTLGLINLNDSLRWCDYNVGRMEKPPARWKAALESNHPEPSLEEWEKARQASEATVIGRVRAMFKKAIPEEFAQSMGRELQASHEQEKQHLIAVKEGRMPPNFRAFTEFVKCVGFSRDGQWLWCGTNLGLRVYDWALMPKDVGGHLPLTRWSHVVTDREPVGLAKWVSSIVEEVDAPAIVFGGCFGGLYRMDLACGERRQIMKLPGERGLSAMAMSSDGAALAVATMQVPDTSRPRAGPKGQISVDICNYPRLRGPFGRGEYATHPEEMA